VENECTLHNFVILTVNVPKIIKVSKNLTSYDKDNFDCFLRHGVHCPLRWKHSYWLWTTYNLMIVNARLNTF